MYSQHIPGISNTVADALSRIFDLNDLELTQLNTSNFHSQVHASFRIYSLQSEVSSWVTCWLQQCKGGEGVTQNTKDKECIIWNDGMNMQQQSDAHDLWLEQLTREQ